MDNGGVLAAVSSVARRALAVPAEIELTESTVLSDVVRIDSVRLMEFVAKLEDELHIEFDVEKLSGPAVVDLAQLVPMVAELLPGTGAEQDGVTITAATGGDADQIVKLQYLCYQSEAEKYRNYAIAPLTQTVDQMRREIDEITVLVAKIGPEVVASVRGRLVERTCHVGRLVTHPRLRRQGIATRLLREVEGRFGEADRFELFTGSRSADSIRLYTRLGYRESRREVRDGGVEMVFLEKRREV